MLSPVDTFRALRAAEHLACDVVTEVEPAPSGQASAVFVLPPSSACRARVLVAKVLFTSWPRGWRARRYRRTHRSFATAFTRSGVSRSPLDHDARRSARKKEVRARALAVVRYASPFGEANS